MSHVKTQLGKQLSSNEWAKAIQEGTIKSSDKDNIQRMYGLIKGRIEDLADGVSKKGEALGSKIKELNSDYSNLLDAKLVAEFDIVRAAKGPAIGYKDMILPGLITASSGGLGGVGVAGSLYLLEKNTGRKLGDIVQMAGSKGLDTIAGKLERAATPKAMAAAKKVRELVIKPIQERAAILSQIIDDNEDHLDIKLQTPKELDSNFSRIVDGTANLSTASDEQLMDMSKQFTDKYGEENVFVKQLTDIAYSNDRKFKMRRKFVLSQQPAFREMVDSLNTKGPEEK